MNAKEEFLRVIKQTAPVKCAIMGRQWYFDDRTKHLLKLNYSERDFTEFLEQIDFEYDNGYGGQELYGCIWLEDGTWFTRGEYDGSEWWDYHDCPKIPNELL